MELVERVARSALTRTGGFLGGRDGFTHTFNPAVGCAYSRGLCGVFCYAAVFAEQLGGPGTWGRVLARKSGLEELLARELRAAGARPPDHPLHVARLRVFASSTTDPCVAPLLETVRRCLRVVARRPPAIWVLQTRSPAVLELEEEVLALGDRATVSFTLETDDEALWRRGPAGAPGIGSRRRAFERLSRWPVRVHLAVAPCLPLADPPAFADWIAAHADLATVDTFTSGDGSGGRRTRATGLPRLLAASGHDWREEGEARRLHDLLVERMGPRAGWSAEGFRRLARPPGTGPGDPLRASTRI